jgi:hypothetical protein
MKTARQHINLDRKIGGYFRVHELWRLKIGQLGINAAYKAGHAAHAEGLDIEKAVLLAVNSILRESLP